MWSILGCAIALMFIAYFLVRHVLKWRNPMYRTRGVLPPGSMGLPLIGETLHLFFPTSSLDLHPFIKNRIHKYGPIFKTKIAGRPVVVSTDSKVNHYLFMQEGKSVELWYLDSMSKIIAPDKRHVHPSHHRYLRSIILNYFGVESIKEKLLPQLEVLVERNLGKWSQHSSIELKHAVSVMMFKFTTKLLFGNYAERFPEGTAETLSNFIQLFMSCPLNIPGTRFHKSLKEKMVLTNIIRDIIKEKQASYDDKIHEGDFLDQVVQEMKTKKIIQEDYIVQLLLITLFATLESNSSTISLALKLLSENPPALEQLQAEHEEIISNRPKSRPSVTWDEYKSMTFTLQVINETLRIASITPGVLRRAMKDVEVNGYIIPAGWSIMIASSAQHLNPTHFKDPNVFNPWRWKDLDPSIISMNFMPFGGGTRQCPGAEFSKALISVFFHVMITRYRWKLLRASNIIRTPVLNFGDGIHIKVSEKLG